MSKNFRELDYRKTPVGELSLRRRKLLNTGEEIYEIKLGDEFLMSSLFTTSEIALADLGIAACSGKDLDVVVGGLGLGYTAKAVLNHDSVSTLLVVDALEAVIDWHSTGLLPLGAELLKDPRCRFIHGNFFEMSAALAGFDTDHPKRMFDAILVDIDHSPKALLDPGNARFYQPRGLRTLKTHLKAGGIFGLWSNEPPDEFFVSQLETVFADARGEPVIFHNPLQDTKVIQTVYLAWV
ncbi:MAG: spermidine synthase [Rhodospirillaceae bacterium]